MRTTGWLCILAAALLLFVSLNTVYTWTLSAQPTSVHAQSSLELPWQLRAGMEALSGAAFLLPGLGMLAPFGAHRRRHRSGS